MTAGNYPNRGWLRTGREWVVETFVAPNGAAYVAGGIPFNSAKLQEVEEAYPLGPVFGGAVGSLIPAIGTIWDHGSGGTVAATLNPQAFKVVLQQTGTGTLFGEYPAGTIGTLVTFTFLLRGH